ncbi:hypothetical protein [Solidesulfovibrio sp.]|uniref:hypothetical protein n=1 Tax=Solidesulfovibrio sp. TaxID=2910990 RepID=UPI002B1FF7EC|nr:hypothetical protein [Solidesulfovibrio sp.]MEA5089751.1 hypothetical protein [Solidesulfovibrio sp.]
MAHTLFQWPYPAARLEGPAAAITSRFRGEVYFRALVEIRSGTVAGIETAPAREVDATAPAHRHPATLERSEGAHAGLARKGRDGAASLVRARLDLLPQRIRETYGVAPARVILMFDVGELFAQPTRSLELLVACKRVGARILLDNFDLDTPPARFMELLPADILRVSPGRMPWHWDMDRRHQALEEVLAFAGNLLMDVAVEDAGAESKRPAYKRLGVRYVQGAWRREAAKTASAAVRRRADG